MASTMTRTAAALLVLHLSGALAWVPYASVQRAGTAWHHRDRTFSAHYVPAAMRRRAGASSLASLSMSAVAAETAETKKDVPVSGTLLVSGFLESQERTDAFPFDVLHSHGAYSRIIAFSPDTSFARKRLLGRNARYSGLLDVLDFAQGSSVDLSATEGENPLEGCDAWFAYNVKPDDILKNAAAARAAGVKRVVMVVCDSADISAATKPLGDSTTSPTAFTVLQAAQVVDGREGGPINISSIDLGIDAASSIAHEDAIRIAAECFMLTEAENRAFGIKKGSQDLGEYVRSLRSKGLSRRDEIRELMMDGYSAYEAEKIAKAEEEEKKRLEEEEKRKEQDAMYQRNREIQDSLDPETGVHCHMDPKEAAVRTHIHALMQKDFEEQKNQKGTLSYDLFPEFKKDKFTEYFEFYMDYATENKETGEWYVPDDGEITKMLVGEDEYNRVMAEREAAQSAAKEAEKTMPVALKEAERAMREGMSAEDAEYLAKSLGTATEDKPPSDGKPEGESPKGKDE